MCWTVESQGRRPGGEIGVVVEFDCDRPMFGKKPIIRFWKRRDGSARFE